MFTAIARSDFAWRNRSRRYSVIILSGVCRPDSVEYTSSVSWEIVASSRSNMLVRCEFVVIAVPYPPRDDPCGYRDGAFLVCGGMFRRVCMFCTIRHAYGALKESRERPPCYTSAVYHLRAGTTWSNCPGDHNLIFHLSTASYMILCKSVAAWPVNDVAPATCRAGVPNSILEAPIPMGLQHRMCSYCHPDWSNYYQSQLLASAW